MTTQHLSPLTMLLSRHTRRREAITLLGGAAAGWPFAVRAQQPGKLPTIGFLGGATWESQWAATFVQRLHELGWTEGRTIAIETRWAEGRNEPAEIVAEFVRLKVDIIVTSGTPSILAAKQATSAIPIVFAVAGDPVGTGLVANLARPGGNVTGLSLLSTDLGGKRIELLREVVPVSADWQSWAMSAIPWSCWRKVRFRQPHVRSDSMSSHHRKSGKPRISCPLWRGSRAAPTRFLLCSIHSSATTGFLLPLSR